MSIAKSKKCKNHCPCCGAGPKNIEWEKLDNGLRSNLQGTCRKCGCNFKQVYAYSHTEYKAPKKKTSNKKEIIVRISDGMVQTVDFPDSLKNVIIVVQDYDTDGAEEGDIQKDEFGEYFYIKYGE
jgi:threonine synthase